MLKKFAIIENDIIVNIAMAEDVWPFEDQVSIELSDTDIAEIGWNITNNQVVVPNNRKPNYPFTETISDTEIKFTFKEGDEIVMHNHKLDGGRHTTTILSGEFKIVRGNTESTAVAGDFIKFTKTENHSITAITPGSTLNTFY
jgi:quercetin dioxygenase-like cupin family protein